MIERLKPAIALSGRNQNLMMCFHADFVGTVIYEDDWQIAVRVENENVI